MTHGNVIIFVLIVSQDIQGLGPDFILAFRAGEEHAFDKVFRVFFGPLSFYANQYVKDEKLAEDLVQDCFVELWQRRKKLDHIESIKSYLYRCVYNHCVSALKKNNRKLVVMDELPVEPVESHIVAAETLAQILKVIDHLPQRMQQVLRMYYLEEKSFIEIGREIGIDPETARSHRYRAIQFVRKTIIPG
ncbi:MAG: sigma-70 family RNA polymerase sigma factor [Chitinophagaceae bacterium]